MSNSIKSFITAKIGSPMSLCDDHYAYNLEELRFAISDGASCNLASRIYSRLLVDNFATYGTFLFSENVCKSMCNIWREETLKNIQHLGNPYYLVNLFNNPVAGRAQATFVGLEFSYNNNSDLVWRSYVIGDSVLIFVPKGTKIPQLLFTTNKKDKDESFADSIVFDNSPLTAHPYDESSWTKLIWESCEHKAEEGTFLMMTDALAEWFISSPHDSIENKFSRLIGIDNQEEFEDFINEERERKLDDNTSPLHDDDVTLIVLNIESLEEIRKRGTIKSVSSNYRHIIEQDSKDDLHKRMLEEVSKVKEEIVILEQKINDKEGELTLKKTELKNKQTEWNNKKRELDKTIQILLDANQKLSESKKPADIKDTESNDNSRIIEQDKVDKDEDNNANVYEADSIDDSKVIDTPKALSAPGSLPENTKKKIKQYITKKWDLLLIIGLIIFLLIINICISYSNRCTLRNNTETNSVVNSEINN